jgi:hypothetical protein
MTQKRVDPIGPLALLKAAETPSSHAALDTRSRWTTRANGQRN